MTNEPSTDRPIRRNAAKNVNNVSQIALHSGSILVAFSNRTTGFIYGRFKAFTWGTFGSFSHEYTQHSHKFRIWPFTIKHS